MRRGGRIVLCGVTIGAEAQTDLRALYWSQLTILGSTMGSDEDFRGMLRAVSAAKLKPVLIPSSRWTAPRRPWRGWKQGRSSGRWC